MHPPPPPWLDHAARRAMASARDTASADRAAAVREVALARYPAHPLPMIEEAVRWCVPATSPPSPARP